MIQYNQIDSPISPQSFLRIIVRRFKLMAAIFLGIVITVVGATFLIPPTYESAAKVIVSYQDDWEKLTDQAVNRTAYDVVASELAILKTRGIMEPVVKTLGLDKLEKEPETELERLEQHEKAVARLTKDIKVEREKDTNIIIVRYADKDAQRAARVTNAVVAQYIKTRPRISRDERALQFFDKLIGDLEKRIDVLETNSQVYKSQEKVLIPEKQTQILFTTLADFDKEITRVRTERIAKEARLRVIRQQKEKGYDISIPTTDAGNSLSKMEHLNELRKALFELEMKKSAMSTRYTEQHPAMVAITRDIESTRQNIRNEINELIRVEEADVQALIAQEAELLASREKVAQSISDMSRKEHELDRRTHSLEQLKVVLNSLITQREQARAAAQKKEYLVQARLLEPAAVSFKAAKPNKRLYAALALMLGFFVAFGAAFFVEYFDHSVHTAEDAQYCLGIPVLATIKDVPAQQLEAPRFVPEENIQFKELNYVHDNQGV